MSINKDLDWNPDKLHVNDGAIAIWRPIGASGTPMLASLFDDMGSWDAKKGLVSL